MLSEAVIRELSVKWQTTRLNVAREYLQHLFLSFLYQFKDSKGLAFKGGTALRLLYRSPRFSEDLDFSGDTKAFHLTKLLMQVLSKIKEEGIALSATESKPTSGGFLALMEGKLFEESVTLELNVSFRKRIKPEPILVTSPLHPSYQCLVLSMSELVKEKCEALLARRKPRDYYDLYFLLRGRLDVTVIASFKKGLIEAVKSLDSKSASRELKVFLPVSHHRIAANLDELLLGELKRL